MRESSPTTCIADADSISYLSDVDLAKRKSLHWLRDDFDVRLSNVVSDEINLAPPFRVNRAVKRWAREGATKVDLKAYKRALSNAGVEHVGVHDGELSNFRLGLTLVLQQPSRGLVVYLSDDGRGRSFADERPEISATSVRWRSHDVILYAYIRHHARITVQQAKDALHNVHSLAYHDSPKRSGRLGKYLQWLEQASSIFKQIG